MEKEDDVEENSDAQEQKDGSKTMNAKKTGTDFSTIEDAWTRFATKAKERGGDDCFENALGEHGCRALFFIGADTVNAMFKSAAARLEDEMNDVMRESLSASMDRLVDDFLSDITEILDDARTENEYL